MNNEIKNLVKLNIDYVDVSIANYWGCLDLLEIHLDGLPIKFSIFAKSGVGGEVKVVSQPLQICDGEMKTEVLRGNVEIFIKR